jgi:hypothetical protein
VATQAFYDWVRAGRPYTLIRPARALQRALRGHGLVVYDYPDDSHLRAGTPEDHTPFSVTGWPGSNARWNARGLDVMPRGGTAAGLRELAAVTRQIIRDRDACLPAVMWIKYLNWTDEAGVCRQERWTDAANPGRRTTRTSTDKGHTHISGRSDADYDTRAEGYDPIARLQNPTPQQLRELGMQMLVKGFGATDAERRQVWLVDGMLRRRVQDTWVAAGAGPITNAQVHQPSLLGQLGNGGAVFTSGGDADVWGVDLTTVPQPVGDADPNPVLAAIAAFQAAAEARFAELARAVAQAEARAVAAEVETEQLRRTLGLGLQAAGAGLVQPVA